MEEPNALGGTAAYFTLSEYDVNNNYRCLLPQTENNKTAEFIYCQVALSCQFTPSCCKELCFMYII